MNVSVLIKIKYYECDIAIETNLLVRKNIRKLIYLFFHTGHWLGHINSEGLLFLGKLSEEKVSIVSYITKKDLLLDDSAVQTRTSKAKLLQSTSHGEEKKDKQNHQKPNHKPKQTL